MDKGRVVGWWYPEGIATSPVYTQKRAHTQTHTLRSHPSRPFQFHTELDHFSLLHPSHSPSLVPPPHLPLQPPSPRSPTPTFNPTVPQEPPEGAHEHLSRVRSLLCLEPSMAPTSLGVKARVLPAAPVALKDLPCHLLALVSSLLFSITLASLLFPKQPRHSPALEPLHWLFPLP